MTCSRLELLNRLVSGKSGDYGQTAASLTVPRSALPHRSACYATVCKTGCHFSCDTGRKANNDGHYCVVSAKFPDPPVILFVIFRQVSWVLSRFPQGSRPPSFRDMLRAKQELICSFNPP
jgi:hypothetical protein